MVERVNKLVSVRPLKSRYGGEVGDVVIGRILEIGNKRWRVDTNSKQDGALMLSSINLPGGIQRRKSENDELQMRSFFSEGEILSVIFSSSNLWNFLILFLFVGRSSICFPRRWYFNSHKKFQVREIGNWRVSFGSINFNPPYEIPFHYFFLGY